MKKLLTILIIGIFFLSIGCTKKNENNSSLEYFNEADLIKYSSNENNEMDAREQFKIQLEEFSDFSKKFFSIWKDHIEKTTQLLEKFNNENIPLDEKVLYSRMLLEKYEKFNDDLKQIAPPPEASRAYHYALSAISKRILFFKEFEKGTNIYTLTEIENEAYLYETLFWEEIDNIYNYFDERAAQLGISNNSEFFYNLK